VRPFCFLTAKRPSLKTRRQDFKKNRQNGVEIWKRYAKTKNLAFLPFLLASWRLKTFHRTDTYGK
jgi:hypothetical protein